MRGTGQEATQESPDDVYEEIEKELLVHIETEEKIFYPLLEKAEDLHESIIEAYEEHSIVKKVLEEAGKMSQDDEKRKAKFQVIKEMVEHHIKEEEGDIFKKARKVIKREHAQELGERFEEEKSVVFK